MVSAKQFNALFDELVAEPIVKAGGWQEGRRVFFQDGAIAAAVLRTELRYQPPAKLTLGIRHRFLRGFDELVPSRPPVNPSEYPIKVAPSQASQIASNEWRYQPHNLGRWPYDVISYTDWPVPHITETLSSIGKTLAEFLPGLQATLPPDRMLERLKLDGENAWCEKLWIEDLAAVPRSD